MSKSPKGSATSPHQERRKFQRIPVQFPMDFFLSAGASKKDGEAARVLDICPQGLLLKTEDSSFKKNQQVYLYPTNVAIDNEVNQPIEGVVRWVKKASDGCLNGIFIQDSDCLFQHFLNFFSTKSKNIEFVDAILDALSDSTFLIDNRMRIISLSKKQPLIPLDREKIRGKKLTDVPSIFKLFPSDSLNLKQDLQEVLYTRSDKQHRAVALEYGTNGVKKTYYFNIIYKYMNSPTFSETILLQIKDVTLLCRLKENIEKKNKNLCEHYRLTLMGHIVDELLEDLISPLSAVVGRIDLLKMKMANYRHSMPTNLNIIDWLHELETIDGLVEQITQHCTIAAKRREREKLGAFQQTISLNKIVEETLAILSVHEKFKKIDVTLDLAENLPTFQGEYFDWLNALIALIQQISHEMQTLNEKKLVIKTSVHDDHLVLSISHNAKALKVPLESEAGLAILDFVQKKYETAIEAVGGNGRQKISFYIPIRLLQSATA